MNFNSLGTSAFTGTDNAELGAAWDSGYTGYSAFDINTNRARAAQNTAAIESFNTTTPSNDQYAEVELRVWGTNQQMATAVRMANPSTVTMYIGIVNFFDPDYSIEIYKIVNDAYTQLAIDDTGVAAWATGHFLKTAVLGTDLYLFKDDVELLSASDSAIASGKAGMWGVYYPSLSGALIVDNFDMGDVTGDAAAALHRLMLLGVGI